MVFCRYSLTLVRIAALCAPIAMLMVPTRAPAMGLKIVGNQLILSGPVVGDEPDKVREALASSPGIKIVILRNSGGGNAPAGYQVGQLPAASPKGPYRTRIATIGRAIGGNPVHPIGGNQVHNFDIL